MNAPSNVPSEAPRLAVYAGSFDPITLGHLDVLDRSRSLFDEVILAIGINPNKPPLFSIDERKRHAETLVARLLKERPQGARVRVEAYQGLTIDFARKVGAAAIVRGIRNVTDLASECQLAITNRQVAGVETVFIVTGNRARAVMVSVGDTRDGRVEIASGLTGAERVIQTPPPALTDGSLIEVAQ